MGCRAGVEGLPGGKKLSEWESRKARWRNGVLAPGTEGLRGFGLAEIEREEHPRWQGQQWEEARSWEAGAAQPKSGSRVPHKAQHTHVSPGLSWAVPHCAGYLMLQSGQICVPS